MDNEKGNKINYIFNTGYQILTVLTPLITAPYVSRVLGADGIGQYSYTYSIVTYFVLIATLGTTAYGQREIAYNRDFIEDRSRVFWKIFIFRCITSVAMLMCYMCFIPSIEGKASTVLLFIQSIYILNVAFDITWFFQGLAEFVTITIRNTIVRIISLILIFAFVKSANDVGIYCFILVFSMTAGFVITFPLLKGKICKTRLSLRDVLLVCKACFPLFVPTVAVQVYTVLDKTMIGLFTISNVENGYYDQSEKIVKMTIVLVTSLSTVLAPKIASAYKNGKSEEVVGYMRTLIKYVFMVGVPISIGLFSVSDYFIPFFLGAGYEKCVYLMKIFCPIVIFLGLSNVLGTTYLVQTSKQKAVNISVIVGAIVNLFLNFILIPKYLSVGAAIASIVAEAVVASIQLIAISKHISIYQLFCGIQNYVVAGLVMGGITSILGKALSFINAQNWMIVFVQVLSGATCYFILLYLKKDSMIMMVLDSISRRVKK